MMRDGGRFRAAFPAEVAPPADDARMVLLNAALVPEDATRGAAAAAVGTRPPDDEEVRDVMSRRARDASAATAADPSAMGVMMEGWRHAVHPYLNRAGMVCGRRVAAQDHSRNEGVPPPLPKGLTKSYYCCRCCWRSG